MNRNIVLGAAGVRRRWERGRRGPRAGRWSYANLPAISGSIRQPCPPRSCPRRRSISLIFQCNWWKMRGIPVIQYWAVALRRRNQHVGW